MAVTSTTKRAKSGSRYKRRTKYQKRSGYKGFDWKWRSKNPWLQAIRSIDTDRVVNSSVGFPNEMETKLKYCEAITVNPTPEATSGVVWYSAGSVFDPYVAIGGHQPLFFDNYSQIYEKYQVLWSEIKVTVLEHSVNTAIWNGTAAVTTPTYSYRLAIVRDMLGGSRSTSNLIPTNFQQIMEMDSPNIRWRYINPALAGRTQYLKHCCAPHVQAGLDKRDDTLTAGTTSNPSQEPAFGIVIVGGDGSEDPPGINVQVEILYRVRFFNKNMLQPQN